MELQALAGKLNVARLWAKDESQRMRLGSFKALGGAYAVAQIITDRTGGSDTESDEFRRVASSLTFITASAGNHGLSVAAGARIFGARSVIVLPATVPEAFAARIRRTGGKVTRVNGDYEESVAYAEAAARKNDWLLLADGSWEGYLGPPSMVMEGYTVLAEECRQSFEQIGEWPTHVFLQAGVGGLARRRGARRCSVSHGQYRKRQAGESRGTRIEHGPTRLQAGIADRLRGPFE